jgi:hypothetical protein
MHLTQVAPTGSMAPSGRLPANLQQFEARFSTEEGCRAYLFQLRWPEGFRCPHCGSGKAWAVRATLFQCSNCGSQTSVTADTRFQDTRKPLSLWFRAMWYVTSQKNGASALGLQRVLGLGSYRTTWSWLHKLRRAMVRPGRGIRHFGSVGGNDRTGIPEQLSVATRAKADARVLGYLGTA